MGKVASNDSCLQLVQFESDDMEVIRFHGRFSYYAWALAPLGIFELYNIH